VSAGQTRATLAQDFLSGAGWDDAIRTSLAGDASDRRYERLHRGRRSAVLMDAPPGKGDDPADFIRIGRHLTRIGLSAPRLLADDLHNGFLLLEDLGDGLYARLLARDRALEALLYAAAADTLVHLQARPAPPELPDLSAHDWAEAAAFAPGWYGFAVTGTRPDTKDLVACLTDLITRHADSPRILILRDFHAENLLWLPRRTGLRRVGLLDFQLGQMGQPGYDLVSLLQDARRDVTPATEAAMIRRFAGATGTDMAGFSPAYAVLGAQRALRILGIFARLCLVAGNPGYLPLIPRVWAHLQRNLAHPALASLGPITASLLPEPTPGHLQRIAARCGTHPTR
jgi:N-acetylmuramate 1-kinase